MRAIALSLLLVSMGMTGAAAAETPATELAGSLAASLSEGNAPAFMARFDKQMPGYARLEALVWALVEQTVAGSSIQVIQEEGNDQRRAAELDWVLDLKGERRQQTVKIAMERRGKRWVVTSLEPIAFFRPPGMSKLQ